jgi:hypothetical protein
LKFCWQQPQTVLLEILHFLEGAMMDEELLEDLVVFRNRTEDLAPESAAGRTNHCGIFRAQYQVSIEVVYLKLVVADACPMRRQI